MQPVCACLALALACPKTPDMKCLLVSLSSDYLTNSGTQQLAAVFNVLSLNFLGRRVPARRGERVQAARQQHPALRRVDAVPVHGPAERLRDRVAAQDADAG